ncbi:GNAT family N-acetyltransferase [Halonatronum saccharophilum]|uniref:GNAT family N-acetyltransferase n=1 Tax=Halonatronum saccharophilum TaxID=150060 RepID=UPI000482826C|nr:GNAT family N-acetyltransferase [Halonatronum saccharophilum]
MLEAIRLMREEEEAKVKSLAKSSFGFLHGSLVKTTEHTYVYELSEEIVGVVVLETFAFQRNRLGGVVKWLFTDQKARGRGVASALIEHSVRKLQELGCDEMFTTVEGYNTDSSNRFADQGFMPLSAMQQIRRYGLSLLKIGPKTFHTIDIGHFLWARSGDISQSSKGSENLEDTRQFVGGGALAWWANVLIMSVILMLQCFRVGSSTELMWQLPIAVALVFGVRSLTMKLVANWIGCELEYRIWETGLTLSAIIAVFLGGVFPSPGCYYPKQVRWSYRKKLSQLAIISFFGALSVLILAWLIFAYQALAISNIAPEMISNLLRTSFFLAYSLLIYEVLLPLFPFESYNGRRVWDYNRTLWGILAAGTIVLFLIS